MQEIRKRLSLSDVFIIFIIASLTFMVIPAWIPLLRRGWLLLIVATIIILISKRNNIQLRAIIALVVYGVILFLNAEMGDEYIGSPANAVYEIMALFVPSSLALFCTKEENNTFVRWLVYITFVFLLIEMVASFFVLQETPGLIRGLYNMAKEEANPALMFEYYKMGILDYSMAHAIPILVPPLICFFKEGTRRIKIYCILLVIVCVFLTWFSESTTALLLVVLMIVLGLWVSNKSSYRKNVFIISFMVAVFVVLISNDNLLMGIFDVSKDIVGEESVQYSRIEELQLSLIEDETTGDLEGRIDLYTKSLELFLSNPIFGTNLMPGRHSSLLDRLAIVGLVGFIPLILFFVSYLKAIWKTIIPNRRIYYLECIIGVFLMVSFKGLWVWPMFFVLFIASPCLLSMNRS